MANSTAIITDLTTLASASFTSASTAKAETLGGADLKGMASSALRDANSLREILTLIENSTDADDPQLTLLTSLLGALS